MGILLSLPKPEIIAMDNTQWLLNHAFQAETEYSIWFKFEFHPPNPLPRYMLSHHDPMHFATMVNDTVMGMGIADRIQRANIYGYTCIFKMKFDVADIPMYRMVESRLEKLFRESSFALKGNKFSCFIAYSIFKP